MYFGLPLSRSNPGGPLCLLSYVWILDSRLSTLSPSTILNLPGLDLANRFTEDDLVDRLR